MHAANDGGAHRGEIAGRQALGECRGQTAQEQVVDPDHVFEIKALGGGCLRIKQGTGARQYLERAKGAAIGHALRGRQRLECHLRCHHGTVAAEVDGACALVGVVAQINQHLCVADGNTDLEHAGVVLRFAQAEGCAGQGCQGLERDFFAQVHKVAHGLQKQIDAVFAVQLLQAQSATAHGGDTGPQIPLHKVRHA